MKKIWLISILLILLVGILMFSCKKEIFVEEPVEEPVVVPPAPEPELEPGPEPVKEPEAAVETKTPELEMVSEARCLDNRIELTLTNPTEQTITLAKDAKIVLNGLFVIDPECDKLMIEPGESVYCADISGHFAIRKGAKNQIQINMIRERSLTVVDCS